MDEKMLLALEKDGEKLRQLTGEDHGPWIVPEWQPIETAPLTGTVLLYAVTDIADDGTIRNWKMATGHWSIGGGWVWEGRKLQHRDLKPTHWMALPPPP